MGCHSRNLLRGVFPVKISFLLTGAVLTRPPGDLHLFPLRFKACDFPTYPISVFQNTVRHGRARGSFYQHHPYPMTWIEKSTYFLEMDVQTDQIDPQAPHCGNQCNTVTHRVLWQQHTRLFCALLLEQPGMGLSLLGSVSLLPGLVESQSQGWKCCRLCPVYGGNEDSSASPPETRCLEPQIGTTH